MADMTVIAQRVLLATLRSERYGQPSRWRREASSMAIAADDDIDGGLSECVDADRSTNLESDAVVSLYGGGDIPRGEATGPLRAKRKYLVELLFEDMVVVHALALLQLQRD